MPRGATYGSLLFGEMYRALLETGELSARPAYRFIVCEANGEPLGELARPIVATTTEVVNQATELTLECAASDAFAPYMDRPYRIRVFDRRGNLVETFLIWQPGYKDDVRSIQAQSLQSGLARECLSVAYDVEYSAGTTVAEHIAALLALQENAPTIVLGEIDEAIGSLVRGLEVDAGQTILAAILALHEQVGGYFWVTPEGQFTWKTTRSLSYGQEYATDRNIVSLGKSSDYTEAVTKLYYYGRQRGRNRISLTDAGESEDYLLADEAYLTKYGRLVRIIEDDAARDTATLLRKAQAYLAVHQDPEPTYEARIVDRSLDKSTDYEEQLAVVLGSNVTVYHDEIVGGSAALDIVEIRRNLLGEPVVDVKFGRLSTELVDVVAESGGGGRTVNVGTELQTLMNVCPAGYLKNSVTSYGFSLRVYKIGQQLPGDNDCPFTLAITLADGNYDQDSPDTHERVTVSGVETISVNEAVYTLSARGVGDTTAHAWARECHVHEVFEDIEVDGPVVCDILTSYNFPQRLSQMMDWCPDGYLKEDIAADAAQLTLYKQHTKLPGKDEWPFYLCLVVDGAYYNADDPATFEKVEVYNVVRLSASESICYLSARGVGDSAATTWLADTRINIGKNEDGEGDVPVLCDLLRNEGLPFAISAAMDYCPDAVVYANIDDDDLSLQIFDLTRSLPDTPFDVCLFAKGAKYNADDASSHERVTVTTVTDGATRKIKTLTLSVRGKGDTLPQAWLAGSYCKTGRDVGLGEQGDSLCTLLTEDRLPIALGDAFDNHLSDVYEGLPDGDWEIAAVERNTGAVWPNDGTYRAASTADLRGSEDAPEPIVSDEGSAGESELFALADHKHQGMPWLSGDFTEISVDRTDGEIGYAEDRKTSYVWQNGENRQIQTGVVTVLELPAIPEIGMREVFWTSEGDGTGDNQVWRAYAGQEAWTPTQKLTTLSGEPSE